MFVDGGRADADRALRLQRDEERKRMNRARREFQRWIIDENSIVIPNKVYAWGFLAGSSMLVLGGLAIGLSVGDRIPGVDPLGFASFCWVFAGFVLIVAKSLRVENWPWSPLLPRAGRLQICERGALGDGDGIPGYPGAPAQAGASDELVQTRPVQRCIF